MIRREIEDSVRILAAQGKSLRSISVLLALSRNSVRRILRGGGARENLSAEGPPCDAATLERLRRSFAQAGGNVVRAQEMLAADGVEVSYSTLTRWVREAGLRESPKRHGHDEPGMSLPRSSCCSATIRAWTGMPPHCASAAAAMPAGNCGGCSS